MATKDPNENNATNPEEDLPVLFPLDIQKATKKPPRVSKPKPVQQAPPPPPQVRRMPFQYTSPPQPQPAPSPAPTPAPATPTPSKGCCLGKVVKVYIILAIIGYAFQLQFFQEMSERIGTWWDDVEQTYLKSEEEKFNDFKSANRYLVHRHPKLMMEITADTSSNVPESEWVRTDTLLIVEITDTHRKKYLLSPGTLKKFKNKKKSKEKVWEYTYIYQQVKIEQLMISGAKKDTKVVLKDSENGRPYTVSLKDIYYYDEIKCIFMFNNLESFQKGQRGSVYLPYEIYSDIIANAPSVEEMTIEYCKPKPLFPVSY